LRTVDDWHRQVAKIYREMRKHQIDPSLGTKLTFVANIGATLARVVDETMPKGINTPPDLSRLNDDELAQLEQLLAKAAGHQAQQRIPLGATNE
jgi:predicted flap endonuclease-1-like 5' DNA nuclease